MFQTKVADKIKTQFHVQYISFFENRAVYGEMWKKYRKTGHDTDDNMAHAQCTLDS